LRRGCRADELEAPFACQQTELRNEARINRGHLPPPFQELFRDEVGTAVRSGNLEQLADVILKMRLARIAADNMEKQPAKYAGLAKGGRAAVVRRVKNPSQKMLKRLASGGKHALQVYRERTGEPLTWESPYSAIKKAAPLIGVSERQLRRLLENEKL
jgi:hypothetical protein